MKQINLFLQRYYILFLRCTVFNLMLTVTSASTTFIEVTLRHRVIIELLQSYYIFHDWLSAALFICAICRYEKCSKTFHIQILLAQVCQSSLLFCEFGIKAETGRETKRSCSG